MHECAGSLGKSLPKPRRLRDFQGSGRICAAWVLPAGSLTQCKLRDGRSQGASRTEPFKDLVQMGAGGARKRPGSCSRMRLTWKDLVKFLFWITDCSPGFFAWKICN